MSNHCLDKGGGLTCTWLCTSIVVGEGRVSGGSLDISSRGTIVEDGRPIDGYGHCETREDSDVVEQHPVKYFWK